MAEGLQLELPQSVPKYFCHYCVREVDVVHPELTCARCNNGFIEEVQASEDSGSDESDLDIDVAPPPLIEANLYNLMRRTIRRTLLDITFGPRADVVSQWLDREDHNAPRDPDLEFDDRVLPILAEVLEEGGLGRFHQLANLGDYALGNEWDAIITQILNEAEVTGPPPLPKDQIDTLPVINVRRVHVDNGVQCTICMEDFNLREKAKCLPCDHFFHEECIVPWLEMHATCPICRKQMNVETTQETATTTTTTAAAAAVTQDDTTTAQRDSTRSSRRNSNEVAADGVASSSQESSSSSSPAPESSLSYYTRRFSRHRQA